MSLAESLRELGHLVNGKIVRSGPTFPVVSPATGEVVAQCPDADTPLLDEAVAAARAAQPGWQALGEASRREIIRSLGAAVIEHFAAIDELESLEKGVPQAAIELYMAQVYANHAADTPLPVTTATLPSRSCTAPPASSPHCLIASGHCLGTLPRRH